MHNKTAKKRRTSKKRLTGGTPKRGYRGDEDYTYLYNTPSQKKAFEKSIAEFKKNNNSSKKSTFSNILNSIRRVFRKGTQKKSASSK